MAKSVKTMSTSELIAEYNSLTGATITRFSDRDSAEQRVTDARKAVEKKEERKVPHKDAAKPTKKEKKAAPAKGKKAPKKEGKGAFIRHHVKVDGKEYTSCMEAFKALKLPTGSFQKFRAALKADGHNTISGKKFTLVQQ